MRRFLFVQNVVERLGESCSGTESVFSRKPNLTKVMSTVSANTLAGRTKAPIERKHEDVEVPNTRIIPQNC